MLSLSWSGVMAQVLVRNLEEDVTRRLQERARKHGMSLEESVRDILRDAAKDTPPSQGLGSRIAAHFRGKGFDFEIPQLRGYTIKPPRFDR
jgi:plasmid stability protein